MGLLKRAFFRYTKGMKTIKNDFPIFHNRSSKNRLIYLDNAATTHKPDSVLNAERDFYQREYGTVKRGIYKSGEQATQSYESARDRVAAFIGAKNASEVIFTAGATDSINLIAKAWGELNIGPGDVVVVSELEHHANLLPWQRLVADRGAFLRYIPVSFDGTLSLAALDDIICPQTKLVAITHTSNAVGTHTDIARITQRAREVRAAILIDAAQAIPHQKLNVEELGCDFLVFSGHKMFGPTGIGVAYINKRMHPNLQPYRLGGGMVHTVGAYDAAWLSMPHMLEAGTPPIAQVISLVAAIDYLERTIGYELLARHERMLIGHLINGLESIPDIAIIGPIEELRESAHLLSFIVDGIHAHDVAAYLDCHGIAVRAGHHCAQPLAQKLGITASVRVSVYAYNTVEDIQALIIALKQLVMTFPKYRDDVEDQPYA